MKLYELTEEIKAGRTLWERSNTASAGRRTKRTAGIMDEDYD